MPTKTTSRKKQTTTTAPSMGFHILGIRWYWWILIIFMVMVVFSGICTVLGIGSGDTIVNRLSRAVLGFAGGLLNMLEGSWVLRLGVSLWAIFFIATNASPIVLAWKAHYGKDKTFEEQNKELGIDKEGLTAIKENNADALAGLAEDQQVDALKSLVNEQVTQQYLDQVYVDYQRRIESATSEEMRAQIVEEYNVETEDVRDKARESGVEEPPEPRPLVVE